MKTERAATILVALLLVAAACTPREQEPHQGPWNVVVVLVDTLRADHLGAYGYERPTSPEFDELAADGVLFENARAQASCTFPSTNSALTSRDPAAFVTQRHGNFGIPEEIPDLAVMLRQRGYQTHAVSASPVVRDTPSDVNDTGGFGHGFDGFDESCLWREAACVHRAAQEVLRWRREEQPFFLYLHYMDPHDPYRPPESEPRQFAGDYTGDKQWILYGNPNPIAEMVYGKAGAEEVTYTEAEFSHLIDLYDDEIHYLDRHLGLLVDELRRRRLLEETIVVVLSDHGESFLENGYIKHCRSLYEPEIRTPLLVRVPGLEPRRVATPVGNLDLVPTLLDYVDRRLAEGAEPGTPPPPAWPEEIQGETLRALLEGTGERTAEDGGPPIVFSSIGVWRTAVDDRWKLLVNLRTGEKKLFDLANDPGETTDVLAENRRPYHRLNDAIGAWLTRVAGAADAEAGEEMQRRLKALGYLQ
ncbi:MAG TPA: sulfatase-like hydrolase/transferase [Thermoanaerobaculia bacterium]|nr:sulfatase-like hydrolase/transferase [Thermoanaerobaculia bacterium]